MRNSERIRAIVQAFFVTFLWSTSWVLIKITLEDIPPLIFAGLRYTLAALVLLPSLVKHKASLKELTRNDWISLVILGLVYYAITQGGQFLTLTYLNAVTFSLLLNFSTVLVAILGILGLGEIPSVRQWVGIAFFLAGVLVYFSPSLPLTRQWVGLLLAGITVSASAVASLLGRSVNRHKHIHPTVVTVISMGIGAFVLLGTGLTVEKFPRLDAINVIVILWLAVVNTAIAFTLWNHSLQILSAVESSIINNSMLIQIAILAWIFLGERLSFWSIMGLAVAALGGYLASSGPHTVKRAAPPNTTV